MASRNSQARANIEAWKKSNATELWHVYDKFSHNKVKAWEHCEELCYRFGGSDLKIISHNSFIFTAGFEFADPETGEVMFMYITPNHHTAVEMYA